MSSLRRGPPIATRTVDGDQSVPASRGGGMETRKRFEGRSVNTKANDYSEDPVEESIHLETKEGVPLG